MDVTEKMLLDLNEQLEERAREAHSTIVNDVALENLAPDNVRDLEAALAKITPDVPRGVGSIDLDTCCDYWLGVVWAVRGLDLPDGEQITRQWSMQSARFTEKGFKAAWDAYDPKHEKPIGIGSVYKLARLFDVRNNESPLEDCEVRSVVNSISGYERVGNDSLSVEKTEDALALGFAKLNPELRYVALWGKWMQWDQTVWKTDTTLGVYDRVRQHVRVFAPKKQRVFFKANTVAAVEKLAKSDRRCAATADQWDADDHLLNTPGGVVDLSSGGLQAAHPKFYMSKSTAIGPQGDAPRWREFLAEVTDGNVEYQEFLQRVIGYAASGFTHEHAMFFLYGQGGNGKGIFLNTIQAVMGDYATVASMETFTDSKNDRHPTDMAMLQGARMVFAQETESGRAWAESKIKSLTGGDPVTARFMRQDFFTYLPKFKLLISGNHMPKLKNVDEAMRRRLYLVPFICTFKGKDRDPHLAETLKHEYEGILQWIVDGAMAYEEKGLSPPLVVQEATSAYFESEDLFQQWLASCCDLDANAHGNPTQLFNSFKCYTEDMNEFTGTDREFRERLEKAGFKSGNSRGKGGRHWKGVRLKTSAGNPAGSNL